jgi:hypothetical protein
VYEILIRLIVATALLDLGHALVGPRQVDSRSDLGRIEQASRQALKIDWKPISVFPEEAKRFR